MSTIRITLISPAPTSLQEQESLKNLSHIMAARIARYEEAGDYQARVKSALEQVPSETAARLSQVDGDLELTMRGLKMLSENYSQAFEGQPSRVRTAL